MLGNKLNPVFIAGTDTGVGKTLTAGLLADYLAKKSIDVITQKWVQTGCDNLAACDVAVHRELMGARGAIVPEQVPYSFKGAFSPHLAAALEGAAINIEKIKADFEALKHKHQSVVVEGVGGVFVPFNDFKLVLDLVVRLKFPAVVVVKNHVGAINHALLTLEYLKVRKVKVLGLIFNDAPGEDRRVLEDNPRIINKISMCPVLGRLPFNKDTAALKNAFAPVGEKIWQALRR